MLLKINGNPTDYIPNPNLYSVHSIPMPIVEQSGPAYWFTHLRIIETIKEMADMDFGLAFLVVLGGVTLWAIIESFMTKKPLNQRINGIVRIGLFITVTEMILRAFDLFRTALPF